jgi:segregation and condensation protein A
VSYRVELPIFSGPMDLLLHLVRQQEVDIHEISVARILADYLKHLAVLQQLDLSDIGDFVVMASTLMEIKSRELLPSEAVEIEQELDPRDDLIRRLLEYKRYRDLARQLEGRADHRARQSPLVLSTPAHLVDKDDEDLLDIGNIGIWDLTSAFAKLLEEIGQQGTLAIEVEKRDVGYYTRRLLGQFRAKREVAFSEIFDRTEGRYGLIGTLIALLEMMKQGYLRAHQENCFDEIHLAFRGDDAVTADQILAGITADEERQKVHDAALAEVAQDLERQDLAEHGVDVGATSMRAVPADEEPDDDEPGSTLANLVDEVLEDDETDEEPTYREPPRELGADG